MRWETTRRGYYEGRDEDPPRYYVEAGQYLLDALWEVGPIDVDANGGEHPIKWTELAAYASATGALVEPWEFRAVISMSGAWIRGKRSGLHPASVAPMFRDEYDEDDDDD